MKKYFIYFLLILVLNLFVPITPVIADTTYKDLKGTNFQIKKRDSYYGLVDKETGKEVIPTQYKKIKKIKVDNKLIISADSNNYITLYSPDKLFDNFFEKYCQTNNYLQEIKFENYPQNGIIRYKKITKDKKAKYGLIIPDGDKIHITMPVHTNILFYDDESIAARMLNVTYTPYTYMFYMNGYNKFTPYSTQYKNVFVPAVIKEEVIVKGKEILVKYKDISVGNDDGSIVVEDKYGYFYRKIKDEKLAEYKNIKSANKSKINAIVKDASSIDEVYDYIKENTNFEFINYPQNVIIRTNYGIYIFENGKKYVFNSFSRFNPEYRDKEDSLKDNIYLHNSNSFFSKITGLQISFQNSDNIIYKKEKWGIIDRFGNEKVPFEYDGIYPQGSNISEKIINQSDLNAKKFYIEYLGNSSDSNLYLAKKGNFYGVINDKNEVIVPFKNVQISDDENMRLLQKQLKNKINRNKMKNRKAKIGRFFSWDLPLIVMAVLFLPLIIVYPPAGMIFFMGGQF